MRGAERLQMRRTKGRRKPPGVIYVGRPTIWGNPFRVGEQGRTRGQAVELYRQWLAGPTTDLADLAVERLAGHDLACWCPLDEPCHADVLLEIANSRPERQS